VSLQTVGVSTESGDANGLTGNRARDHLANERTYMAWLRTCLGLAATGALFAKLSDASLERRIASVVACTVVSVAILGYGTKRYYEVMNDLEQGRFRASGRSPVIITIAVGTVLVVVLPLLVA
jgi:putative membrane protein